MALRGPGQPLASQGLRSRNSLHTAHVYSVQSLTPVSGEHFLLPDDQEATWGICTSEWDSCGDGMAKVADSLRRLHGAFTHDLGPLHLME